METERSSVNVHGILRLGQDIEKYTDDFNSTFQYISQNEIIQNTWWFQLLPGLKMSI